MPKIVVTDRDGNEHEVEGRAGLKVMETLRELDYGVTRDLRRALLVRDLPRFVVSPDWIEKLPEPQGDEKELLVELSHYDAGRSRLSCQLEFTEQLDGLEVTIAPDE